MSWKSLRGRIIFFSSRRRHTTFDCDWSSDVCSSDLVMPELGHGSHEDQGRADESDTCENYPSCADAVDYCAGHQSKRRSEEHTSELQSQSNLVCRLLLEKKKHLAHNVKNMLVLCNII